MKTDIQNFDIDMMGALERMLSYRLQDGKRLYEMRIASGEGKTPKGNEYKSVSAVGYFGSLEENSLKPQTKIRFLQAMLPSGSIHQIVFTKNYVASGDPVTPEYMREAFSEADADFALQKLGKIQK